MTTTTQDARTTIHAPEAVMSRMQQARQGDVYFTRISRAPAGRPLAPEAGRLILARGEVTGHHHSVPAGAGTLTLDEGGIMYLTIAQLTAVEHQEHAPVPLEPGIYRVTRQREYAGPERDQWVAD
jgi:hypothetical protein